MKKLILIGLLLLLITQDTKADEPVFLPIIVKSCPMNLCPPIKNDWKIIKPIGTTNYVMNPSGETTSNFAAQGSATITRSTTYQKYGRYSYRVQTTGHGQGLSLTTNTLTNSVHWFTARIRNTVKPPELRFNIGPSSQKPTLLERIDNAWDLYGVMFGATESNGATTATITQFGLGASDFYVDGIQIEPLGDWSTYCDGTQGGCAWNGPEHAATSSRSNRSSEGGQPQDLFTEYQFFVQAIIGGGASTQELIVDSYALLPGGQLNNIKVQPRDFTIVGKFIGNTQKEIHLARKELEKLLRNNTSIKLQYSGAEVQKEISVTYKGGLEGEMAAFYKNFEAEGDDSWIETFQFTEKASIQFLATDPYWYEVGESAVSLDTNDSATFRIVAGRLRSTGQWSNLGPPSSGGTYTEIRAIAEDATYVYFGGNFLNFNGIAAADYIVRYHKGTGTYSALDVGLNGIVYALALAPNGDLYIGGAFTNAGGVAAADYLTRWDGAAYNAVGVPNTGAANIVNVFTMIIARDGILYIGGNFEDWNDISGADGIVMWNGTNYNALSSGLRFGIFKGQAISIAEGIDGTIYVGGVFDTAGGVSADHIASWDGTSFSAMGTGTASNVNTIAVDKAGVVYVGGNFTTIGGNAINYIAIWNGVSFSALGSGTNGSVYNIAVAEDSIVYLSGAFTQAGGITVADRITRWNGYTYAHVDIDLPGLPIVYHIRPSKYTDPVLIQRYDLFVGFDTSGTGSFAGKVLPENEGSVPAFPKAIFERSATGFPATIQTLRNETLGKELLLNYTLLAGERLTIDLTPTKRSIISSFFGSRPDAVLANSDLGTWVLDPGTNEITNFINTSGALYGDVTTSYLLWRDKYDSYD